MHPNRQPAFLARGYSFRDWATSFCRGARLSAYLRLCSLILALVVLGHGSAHSQTLIEALTATFAGNPGLDAERARQRADEEIIKQEWAKALPNISLNSYKGKEHSWINSFPEATKLKPEGYSLTLTQPLFRGFQTYNGIHRAKAEVQAGMSQLHDREQSTLLFAVTAYMDVLQDRKIAKLRQDNVNFLRSELKGTKARRKAGDLSKTDVAQARTRLFEGEADLAQAQADMEASEADFESIIGRRPATLTAPRVPSELLPPTLNAALGVAASTNPTIIGALHSQEAARRAKNEAYGALLPTVSLELNHGVERNDTVLVDKREESSIFVRMKIPLYQGGDVRSRIRQSRAQETSSAFEVSDSRRRIRAGVIDAWKQLYAAKARIKAATQQVQAARQALKGVKIEVKVGERALFEVLDAQRELVNGQVALARAEHDNVVSSHALLAATGRLTARYLNLPVAYPDLDRAVRKKHPKPYRSSRYKAGRKTVARSAIQPKLIAPVLTASQKVAYQILPPSKTPVQAQIQWQTSVAGITPAKPVRHPAAARTVRHTRAARPVRRVARQAPNPLASLRMSLPAD